MNFKTLSMLALLLAVAASVSLTGCARNEAPENATPDTTVVTPPESTPAPTSTEVNITTPAPGEAPKAEVNMTMPSAPPAEKPAEPAAHGEEHKAD